MTLKLHKKDLIGTIDHLLHASGDEYKFTKEQIMDHTLLFLHGGFDT
eukprot:CAMPEP_0168538756 /NCGR_PEP_ID=MMETSP0405-20121227/21375_1 /TAXON_ID=498012 /ORGANISM="Trichosphaerium sp, Strain Am-I-7 wt" /LENGTH=46 /DNA_ID= /DNA_START= /DNA_END= /DNA_ORIENTATION=